MRLAGKQALVTGSGKGIGRGIALSLAESGAELFLHYRSKREEAESLLEEITQMGGKAHIFRADLSNDDELDAMFTEIKSLWSGLDIAVNNAGWDPGYIQLDAITPDLYYRLSDINIKGTLFCCLREIELMRENANGGSIINIGSVQQDTSVPGRTLYAMSKGAIHAMTGQLALEAGPFGIRVNNIAPGYIEVDRMSKVSGFNRDQIAEGIPLGRIGNVRDAGEFAVFLASTASSFITGQTLVIDGGVSRKLARDCRIVELQINLQNR
ncbi:MAG: SDR family oxidoreductase [Victivallales bacterium]|nr:SDR family oxidoreductase [Victivallales bacterium]